MERAVFLSSAILKEAEVRARGKESDTQTMEGRDSPAVFMRLTLTEDAYSVVRKMPNAEFREFVSAAILQRAKRRYPSANRNDVLSALSKPFRGGGIFFYFFSFTPLQRFGIFGII